MADLKTKMNNASVDKFLDKISKPHTIKDCYSLIKLMKQITKAEPKMWGNNIVGFGSYHYKYESSREGDWFLTGFSPRKQNLTIYIMCGFGRYNELMQKLGKYKTGKSCLYIKRIDDVDVKVLKKIISESVKYISKKKWV